MPEISVIIPVYNCGKYLKKCVDSVLNQSFKDLELILINDGSFDGSGNICEEYQKKDCRVKVIHQENKGVSSARNAGLDVAQGRLIGFVDSDDYLAPDMYEFLYNNLKNNKAHVSICGIVNCFIKKSGATKQVRQSPFDGTWILTGKEALKEVLKSRLFSVNPVNKLFDSKLFKGKRYPAGKISEDAFLIPEILSLASKVVYDSNPKYYYIRRENSITTSEFSLKDWNVTEAYKNHLSVVKRKFPDLIKEAEFRYMWSFIYVLDKMISCTNPVPKEEYKKALEFVKKNACKILRNPCFSFKRKLAISMLLLNENLYKKMVSESSKS